MLIVIIIIVMMMIMMMMIMVMVGVQMLMIMVLIHDSFFEYQRLLADECVFAINSERIFVCDCVKIVQFLDSLTSSTKMLCKSGHTTCGNIIDSTVAIRVLTSLFIFQKYEIQYIIC